MRKLIFYGYDQQTVGGVQNLFINFIKDLSEKSINTIVFCKQTSYVFKNIQDLNPCIQIINTTLIPSKKWCNYINENDVLLIGNFTSNLRPFLKKNPFIVFWTLLPGVFRKANNLIIYSSESKTKKLINYLIDKNGMLFMDKCCLTAVEHDYQIILNHPQYLPVPTQIIPHLNIPNRSLLNKQKIIITYLGRGGVMWKIYPVKKILLDIENSDYNINIDFVIITDIKELFQQEIALLNLKKTKVSFQLNLTGNLLDEYLSTNSDLHFAMGTSALESAKFGVPTILIDPSNKEYPFDYKYKWIYDNKLFELGIFIDLFPYSNENRISMNALLSNLCSDWSEFATRSYSYVKENHSLEKTTNSLLDIIEVTDAKLSDFIKLTLRQSFIFQSIRSIIK